MRLQHPAPHLLLAVLLVLGLAACAGDGDEATPARSDAPEASEDRDANPDTPDAEVPESAGVVLSREGLGVARFGDEAEAALAALREAMGKPNTVTKWLPMERSLWGACPGSEVRGARWGDLWVLFSDRSELGERPHLSGWTVGGNSTYGRTRLKTPEGIGLGSTLTELRAAYADRLELETFQLGGRFTVTPESDEKAGSRVLAGAVTGADDDDTVRSLEGGLTCEA